MTEKSPADQRCRIGRCRTPLPALLRGGSRDSWASSLYCCRSVSPYTAITFASSSSWSSPATAFKRSSWYALVDLEVFLVKSGANTLCRHISCRVIHVAEILLWCRRKVMCTTISYFLPRGSSLFSYTGLFLPFRKKIWGGTAPPAPPLATALRIVSEESRKAIKKIINSVSIASMH